MTMGQKSPVILGGMKKDKEAPPPVTRAQRFKSRAQIEYMYHQLDLADEERDSKCERKEESAAMNKDAV